MKFIGTYKAMEDARKNLPMGHVDRTRAEKAYKTHLAKEYGVCQDLEIYWSKRLPRAYRFLSRDQVRSLYWYLCDSIGTKQVNRMYFPSPEPIPGAAAHYNPRNRSVHFYSAGNQSLTTAIHELAHHVQYMEGLGLGHGEGFVCAENILFEAARPILLNWSSTPGM